MHGTDVQKGVEGVSVERRVVTGRVEDEEEEGRRCLHIGERTLTLARQSRHLRRVTSTPEIAMRKHPRPQPPLPKVSGVLRAGGSLPDLQSPAQPGGKSHLTVGNWMDKLLQRSGQMLMQMQSNRAMLTEMRNYIQSEYELAGVQDPAYGLQGAQPTVQARLEGAVETHEVSTLPPIK
jgi:hypothetical protein